MANSDKKIIRHKGYIADEIIRLSDSMQSLTDDKLKTKTAEFRARLDRNEGLEDILIEVYAVGREVTRRITGMSIFRVQIIGAIFLHEGDVAEMRTGEGKTITCVLPAYLNALTKKGVHIITVNEYLAERDAESNGLIFNFLGLTVGLNLRARSRLQKKEAFQQDITYTTNSELGFDYLRDNMVGSAESQVLRPLHYAIIDEADSVLIDEARTPLIISGGYKALLPQYKAADAFVKSLKFETDIEVDKESRQAFLTKDGSVKAQDFFSLSNLYLAENTVMYHAIMNALKANYVFRNEVEYLVKDSEIFLIDQHTGRLMEGRSYSDGLQQAIQAKESVDIEDETVVKATITYQNFFRLYNKLSGMTGTAKTEEEEFLKIYNMRVVCVPTDKPIIRVDNIDKMFATRTAKLKYLIKEVQRFNDRGQPILIGTTSVDESEIVARYLHKAHFKFEMLNAKNHKREADIIMNAGKSKSITLATNMAGRGTDIKLGDGIAESGGLVVIGIGRNEARRIDNQLRGRSGRQGDPGESHLLVAADDQLIVRFGGKRLIKLFSHLEDDFLQSKLLTHSITSAQKKLEGMNFDQRKNILDYDNVIAQHREAIYSQRNQILRSDDLNPIISQMQYSAAYHLTEALGYSLSNEWFIDFKKLLKETENVLLFKNTLNPDILKNKSRKEVTATITEQIKDFFDYRVSDVPHKVLTQVMRGVIISTLDEYWENHISNTQKLRSGIYLRSYAQRNPLHSYVEESASLYRFMKLKIAFDVITALAKVVIRAPNEEPTVEEEEIKVSMRG